METPITFPTENEIISKLSDLSDPKEFILQMKGIVAKLCGINPNKLPPKSTTFLEKSLPNSFYAFVSIKDPPQAIQSEILSFAEVYITLVVCFEFPQKLVNAITNMFPEESRMPSKIAPIVNEIDGSNLESYSNPDASYLSPKRPKTTYIMEEIIKQLFSCGMFRKTLDIARRHELSSSHLVSLIPLVKSVLLYLDDSLSQTLLISVVELVIEVLRENPDSQPLFQFLFDYMNAIPNMHQRIADLYCNCLPNVPQNFKSSVVQNLIESVSLHSSPNQVKNTLIDVITQKNCTILLQKTILNYLLKLASTISFNQEDIIKLLQKPSFFEDFRCNLIIKMLPLIPDGINQIALFLSECNGFHQGLICSVIGYLTDESTIKSLFLRLMREQDTLTPAQASPVTMNPNLKNQILSSLNIHADIRLVKSMCKFFMNAPYLSEITEFIMQLTTLSFGNSIYFELLESFATIMNDFDSSVLINSLFNIAIKNIGTQSNAKAFSSLVNVVSYWISCLHSIQEKKIFPMLYSIDYYHCPNKLPVLIDSIIDRTTNEIEAEKLIFKIVEDTIPIKFAHWLTEKVFDLMHHKKDLIERICSVLVQNLSNERKKKNTIYMIYECAIYESDFYCIDSDHWCNQKFSIHEKRTSSLTVSFLSYHSTRRLYYAVANHSKIPMNQIDIQIKINDEYIPLIYNHPLSSIEIIGETKVHLEVKTLENIAYERKDIPPHFLNSLANYHDFVFSFLLDNCSDSEYLFSTIQLLKPLIKCAPQTSIQRLFHGFCMNPIDFIQSKIVLPTAILYSSLTKSNLNEEQSIQLLNHLLNMPFDTVSEFIISKHFPTICSKIEITNEFVRYLIQSKSIFYRKMLLSLIPEGTNPSVFIANLSLTTDIPNRSFTKEYFAAIEGMNIDSNMLTQLFVDLPQYEFSQYIDPDITFISLLKLIPANHHTIGLSFERLTKMPTVRNPTLPYIQTSESREAAFEFMKSKVTPSLILPYIRTIPAIPQSGSKLKEDLTYTGRNGISNLGSTCYIGSLIQSLNTLRNVAMELLSLPRDQLSPYVMQIRNVMGRIRYGREPFVSIRQFVETIPEFDPTIQADVEEFLNNLINKLSADLGPNEKITPQFKGQIEVNIMHEKKILSSSTDDFFYLSLRTKDLLNLDESFHEYFREEPITYKNEDGDFVKAFKANRIVKWPQYLVIQLQRYEYTFDLQERIKLIHEYAFPVSFDPDRFSQGSSSVPGGSTYSLSSVVIHEGDTESGHYFSVVRGEDNEWYICNDMSIEYFDITKLKSWAFGVGEESRTLRESIWTGYLLFYKRNDLPKIDLNIEPDMEKEIDILNQNHWPSVILFSEQFLNFSKDLNKICEMSHESLEILFTMYFRVTIIDDTILTNWSEYIKSSILSSKENCQFLFNFIEQHLGKTLGNLIFTSDFVSSQLSSVIQQAFIQLNDTTQPLLILIKCLSEHTHKRTAQFLLELFSNLSLLNVNWVSEDEALLEIIGFITSDSQKEVFKYLAKQHYSSFESIISIIKIVFRLRGVTPAVYNLFCIESLNRVSNSARKSDIFLDLLPSIAFARPSLYRDLSRAGNPVKSMLSSIELPEEEPGSIITTPDVDVSYIWNRFSELLFHTDCHIREEVFCAIDGLLNNCALCHNESSIHHYILGLVSQCLAINNSNPECIIQYLKLLHKTAKEVPQTTALCINELISRIKDIEYIEMKEILIDIIGIILQSVPEFQINEEIINHILDLEKSGIPYLRFISTIGPKASESKLLNSNIEFCLVNPFDEYFSHIQQCLLSGGISHSFKIPDVEYSFNHLPILNLLWTVSPENRIDLSKQILKVLESLIEIPFQFNNCILQESFEKCYATIKEESSSFLKLYPCINWIKHNVN